jgi:hypothetical protein
LVDRGVKIAADLKARTPQPAKLKDFKAFVKSQTFPEIEQLKKEVNEFALSFPMPGM